jgi:putative Mn2+ efflux pump MntP
MDLATMLVAHACMHGLAMDSFSVSIANGLARRKFESRNALKIAFFFGVFQGVMLLIGWSMGVYVMDFIAGFDHWIAFLLLFLIGCRMI